MPRTVSTTFREAFWADETDKVALLLLELNHADLASPYRFALNTEKVRQKPVQTTLTSGIGSLSTGWSIASSSGLAADDPVTVLLDSGEYHDTIVASIDTGFSIVVETAPPSDAASGNEVSKYVDYLPFPFEVELPQDVPGSPLRASLRIDNIDRSIASTLRGLSTSPTVVLTIVLADTPDVIEVQTPELIWETTNIDAQSVRGELTGPRIMNRSFPMEDFTPTTFPNIFV